MSKHPYQILIKPLLTERASSGQGVGKYSFKVDPSANKIEIRKAVESAFKVRVESVNTTTVKGKRKRLRTAKLGKRADWKKAVVRLAEGDSINLI